MFKGTLKDIITNVVAFIAGAVSLLQAVVMAYNTWVATASQDPSLIEWVQLIITIGITVVAWYTGKGGNGKAKPVL